MTEAAVSFQQTIEQWLGIDPLIYIEHNPKLFRSVTAFPDIVDSNWYYAIDQDTRAIVQKCNIDDT
jgi:hypothetical protein